MIPLKTCNINNNCLSVLNPLNCLQIVSLLHREKLIWKITNQDFIFSFRYLRLLMTFLTHWLHLVSIRPFLNSNLKTSIKNCECLENNFCCME